MSHDDLQKAADSPADDVSGQGRRSLAGVPVRTREGAASLAQVPTCTHTMEAWMRKVNDRWLVHSGLNHDARAYLDHLASSDPGRLHRTCEVVKRIMAEHDSDKDPKPLFYGGLFSLTTPAEETAYLSGHRFTRLLLPSTPVATFVSEAEDLELAPHVRQRIAHIREFIATAVRDQEPVTV